MVSSISRRELLKAGGVAAGAAAVGVATDHGVADAQQRSQAFHHKFSFIGEYSQTGAYVTSRVVGPSALGLAYSTSRRMHGAQFVAPQPVDGTDHMVRHDLDGLLQPGQQYFVQLTDGSTLLGRRLSFRTRPEDSAPEDLRVALLSCQRNLSSADLDQPGWAAVRAFAPDLLLHGGDFGYWGGQLEATQPYVKHIDKYEHMLVGLGGMRNVLETTSSMIQVSDHELSANDGDTLDDPLTTTALNAYWRLMPFRAFDDTTQRSRFLARQIGTHILLISIDFRNLDRSLANDIDDEQKTALGAHQFDLLVEALKRPIPLKIILSDPGCTPADPPARGQDGSVEWQLKDKWCNYTNAFQRMVSVIANETTTDGMPINVDVWSGDRHVLGVLDKANNRWATDLFDVLTSSGIDQDANELEDGEIYDQVFGVRDTVPGNKVKQHMEIILSDHKDGTITRTATGYNDQSPGGPVVTHTRTWSYQEPR